MELRAGDASALCGGVVNDQIWGAYDKMARCTQAGPIWLDGQG
uniref:Uncharacterized protein n=1 Tax=Oryza sativa subsp. japonica TaxID=39947 RepID=H2KW26_ORYSJ|nr:hypothetical protein LOC_Os11g08689 [Oryza sativa Japonica Group]